MPEAHLRAADADRAALATVLGEHMAAGRLTVGEYEERLGRAYTARTYGELAELTTDLPAARATVSPAPAERSPRAAPEQHHRRQHGRSGDGAGDWRSWASTAAIVLVIWAVTSLVSGELRYFWPVWVIGPWGAVLLIRSLGRRGGDDGPQALPG